MTSYVSVKDAPVIRMVDRPIPFIHLLS